jgi:hypothetical protein
MLRQRGGPDLGKTAGGYSDAPLPIFERTSCICPFTKSRASSLVNGKPNASVSPSSSFSRCCLKSRARSADSDALIAESERNAAMMAVDAVLEFVVSVPGWERRDLGGPLWQLLTALKDLDSGRVGSMLSPNPEVRNRKPDARMRKIVKAYALFFVDVLCRSEWSVTEGCGIQSEQCVRQGPTRSASPRRDARAPPSLSPPHFHPLGGSNRRRRRP